MINLCDEIPLQNATYTKDGFLSGVAKCARTGIQDYLGREVDRPDLDLVRVYRPGEEVFHTDSLKTYAGRPITDNHPSGGVNATNWKGLSIGHTGSSISRDGDTVVVPLAIMDAKGVAAIRSGKRELSMGYECELDWTPGVTEDGQAYDAVQRNIRINHLSIVDKARGGPSLRIDGKNNPANEKQDCKPNEESKIMNVITLDGLSVSIADGQAAAIVQKYQNDMAAKIAAKDAELKKMKDLLKAADEAIEKSKEEDAKNKAELAKVKKDAEDNAITPEKIADAAKELNEVTAAAKALAPSLKIDGMVDPAAIRKAVVDSQMADNGFGDSQACYDAAFKVLVRDIDAEGGKTSNNTDGEKLVTADAARAEYYKERGIG